MQTLEIYSTPLWETEYPNFNEDKNLILDSIFEYKKENLDFESNQVFSAYQSPNFLHSKENLADLFNYICSFGSKICEDLNFEANNIFVTSSWFTCLDSKRSLIPQTVSKETFSGVFFLKVPEKSGNFCIINPAMNSLWNGNDLCQVKNQFTAEKIKLTPEEGNILIWPSYVPYYVESNDHDEETILLFFNILSVKK